MLKAKERKIIYICAENATPAENMDLTNFYTEIVLRIDNTPIAPPAFYGGYLNCADQTDKAEAFEVGISLLCRCDEVWIFGNTVTEKMAAEIRTAQNLDIKARRAMVCCVATGVQTSRLPAQPVEIILTEV